MVQKKAKPSERVHVFFGRRNIDAKRSNEEDDEVVLVIYDM